MQSELNIINNTQSKKALPVSIGRFFLNVKNAILNKKYELNIIFTTSQKSKELNRTYRKKNEPTNILSFLITKQNGEIFIDLKQVKKNAKLFNMDYENFLKFLIIHGILHLKGYDHGPKMEKLEKKYCHHFTTSMPICE